MSRERRILAIDPGTRYWGVAVFKGRILYDAKVRTLKTKDSPGKRLNEVKRIFISLIEDHAPEILVIEKSIPFWSKQSRLLSVVIDEIKSIAKREKMKIYEIPPKSVKKIVCKNGNATKKEMKTIICSLYPDLKIYLRQATKSQEKYWNHMFDAVGLGVCYLKEQGKIVLLVV